MAMPAPEILRELRFRPRVVAELLSEALGVRLPRYDGVDAEALDGGAAGDEPPLVVVLSHTRVAQCAIVVDALETCESPQRLMWPRWADEVATRRQIVVHSLVVTSDDVVETWAKQPVHLDDQRVFQPHVIGPSAIPTDGSRTPALVLMTIARRILPRA